MRRALLTALRSELLDAEGAEEQRTQSAGIDCSSPRAGISWGTSAGEITRRIASGRFKEKFVRARRERNRERLRHPLRSPLLRALWRRVVQQRVLIESLPFVNRGFGLVTITRKGPFAPACPEFESRTGQP